MTFSEGMASMTCAVMEAYPTSRAVASCASAINACRVLGVQVVNAEPAILQQPNPGEEFDVVHVCVDGVQGLRRLR